MEFLERVPDPPDLRALGQPLPGDVGRPVTRDQRTSRSRMKQEVETKPVPPPKTNEPNAKS